MKRLKAQLKSLAKSLANLSNQVDKITQQVDKLQPAKKAAAKKKAPAKKAAAKKKAPAKKAAAKKGGAAKKETVLDTVLGMVKKARKGITIADLKAKTGLNSRQLSNALYKLSKRDLIATKSRGLYVKK